jgi:hypothetical protein
MSTELVAILIVVVGILGVIAVSYTFYVVGRSEDRDRAEAAKPPPAGEPPVDEPPADEPPHGELARERSRRRPPRRPN